METGGHVYKAVVTMWVRDCGTLHGGGTGGDGNK